MTTPASFSAPPLVRLISQSFWVVADYRLPDKQRKVLVLFELEELSTQQIADLIGARLGTVRVWLFRARARFLELDAKLEANEEQRR